MKKKNKASGSIAAREGLWDRYGHLVILCLSVAAVLFIAATFSGKWFWREQPYNSYVLQAKVWLQGRLDLGQNYSWLEIAVFNGKYYISFPPFPSYVMLPFVMFGYTKCDGLIALITSILGAAYAYKIFEHMKVKKEAAVFFALFLTVGSNWLMTAQTAWVWFIAQNMAFTLSLMAIYYALKNKAGLSLLFWAFAVGCRPLQAFYLPVLLYLIYRAHKAACPTDSIADMVKKRWSALLPMAAVALSYMILNFARFANPLEFGHNYLPEFTESAQSQFSLGYIGQNLPSLFKLPPFNKSKFVLDYPMFNGMCIFMISPVFISYIVYSVYSLVRDKNSDRLLTVLVFISVVLEILAITAHKTMGGSHFGNRYINDVLPLAGLAIASVLAAHDGYYRLNYPLFFMGFTLNLIGTVGYFMTY